MHVDDRLRETFNREFGLFAVFGRDAALDGGEQYVNVFVHDAFVEVCVVEPDYGGKEPSDTSVPVLPIRFGICDRMVVFVVEAFDERMRHADPTRIQ